MWSWPRTGSLAPISHGLRKGAENLLVKAMRAMRAEDLARAAALVQRAVGLPFDEHEESAPVALAAESLLFGAVTDALEECDEGDGAWLEPALALLDRQDEVAWVDLGHALADIAQDYDISARERQRILAAIGGRATGPELVDETDLSEAQLRERVLSILRLCLAYDEAWLRHATSRD